MPFIRTGKSEELEARMKRLGIREEDITERFIHGSGRGGQKKNKSANCVYLKHKPSGIEVKIQKSRSREVNRFLARRILCDKIEALRMGKLSAREKERFKIRKQKARRSRRAKEKMLEAKRQNAEKKAFRGPVGFEE
ncbi:peptide chain release factor-like protein [bacterium]|nr:peptide chain release factor-like protein [bacterium]